MFFRPKPPQLNLEDKKIDDQPEHKVRQFGVLCVFAQKERMCDVGHSMMVLAGRKMHRHRNRQDPLDSQNPKIMIADDAFMTVNEDRCGTEYENLLQLSASEHFVLRIL